MSSLNTFVLLLIAGSIVTLGYGASQKGLLKGIIDLNYIPGTSNFNISGVNAQAIDELLRASCERNGGRDHTIAYDTAKEGWKMFLSCEESESKQIVIAAYNQMTAGQHVDPLIMFKKYCVILPTEKNCLKQLKDSIEPCLDLEERGSMNIIYNALTSLLEIVCKDNGARVEKLIADGSAKCFQSKKQALLNCVNEITSLQKKSGTEIQKLYSLIPDAKDCTEMDKFQHCSVEALQECKQPSFVEMVGNLFHAVKKAMNCENLLESQASPATVVNVLLTTVVTAFFCCFS